MADREPRNWLDLTVVLFSFIELLAASLGSHLAATGGKCCQVAAKWLPEQVAAKWLPEQVAATGCNWLPSGCQAAAKWLPEQVIAKWLEVAAAAGCDWLPSGWQVAASGCKRLPSGCLSKCLQVAARWLLW